jgi:hypothetical protein
MQFASVEGFVHFIKIPNGAAGRALRHLKQSLPDSSGNIALKLGREINGVLRPSLSRMLDGEATNQPVRPNNRVHVHWKGERYVYGSEQHHGLIKRALEEKFKANDDARDQLLATVGKMLVHETGGSESRFTSLPAATFCEFLEDIRQRLVEEQS